MPKIVQPPPDKTSRSFLGEFLSILCEAANAFPFGRVTISSFIASGIKDVSFKRRLAFTLVLFLFSWAAWSISAIGTRKVVDLFLSQFPSLVFEMGWSFHTVDYRVVGLTGYALAAYTMLAAYRHTRSTQSLNSRVSPFPRAAFLGRFTLSLVTRGFAALAGVYMYLMVLVVLSLILQNFGVRFMYIHLILGSLIALYLAHHMPDVVPRSPQILGEEILEGSALSTHEKAMAEAHRQVAKLPESLIDFGALRLPLSFSEKHFLLVGAPGGGKSVYLLKLMKSVFAGSAQARALIYDGKNELVPSVMALCPGRKVIILNPLDARSVAWDIAADTTRFTDAQEIAKLLYPEGSFQGGGGDQGFFDKAGRNLLSSLFMTFNHLAPGDWTLRDVLAATRGFESRLLPILKTYRQENQALLEYFANPEVVKMALSILTSLTEQLNKFRAVAAIWDRCPKDDRFSLDRWIREGQEILVLGSTSRAREAAHAISSVFLERTFKLVLEKENNSQEDRTWFFLDEMREAPRLDGFGTFLSQARTKGGSVAMTFQSFAGFKVVYGDDSAQEVSGFPGNRMFFRCADTQTDTWVRNQFGKIRIRRTKQSVSETEGEVSTTSQNSEDSEQDVLIEGYLLNMLPASKENGFHSLNFISGLGRDGAYSSAMPFQETINSLPPKSKDPEQELRPAAHEEFRDWTEADLKRLNLHEVVSLEVLKDVQSVPPPAPTRPPDDDNPDDMGVLAGL